MSAVNKRLFKYLALPLLSYVLLCFITPYNKFLRNRSINNQISYLSKILNEGHDDELQARFPEGKQFSNSLLALSVIEFYERNEVDKLEYAKIVDDCILRIQSKASLKVFDSIMDPEYGMFYNAWSNFVYRFYQDSKLFERSEIQNAVIEESKLIDERLTSALNDSIRLLDSYPGLSWPADNLIGALSLKDKTLQKNWVNKIIKSSQHNSGLVHHIGGEASLIRGSSSAMITYCLNRMGYEKAEQYRLKHQEVFVDELLGVRLVKENEDGSNEMDADSGPVIFGYGASATIMNIKTQASFGGGKSTWALMNLIAMPVNLFKRKYYLFQQETMLDLFMLWGSVEFD